jgi:hypothetical protein
MDNISNSANKINEMYSDLSYFDQYGGSVFLFFILVTILFVIVSYTTVMRNMQPIKDDWINQRCKPQVIPFAGIINKPYNMSAVDFTGQNFTYCMQNILTNITGYAVQPISYMTYAIKELFEEIDKAVQYIRTMLSSIRTNMTKIAQEILGRIANIMVPIQQILIAFKDAMGKVKGVLTAGLYTSLGSYYALKAMLGAIVQFIIIIMIVLAALIIAMWIIPFTWPVAISMTAVFASISIPLAIIVAFMTEVLHVQTEFSIPGIPSRPTLSACFDKNTLLKMNDGTYKKIIDIHPGDILTENNIITAKMELDSIGQIMYNINGILVSGNHKIIYNGEWISVSQHPHSKRVENYGESLIYCLNTGTKRIVINNEIYMDWDELYEEDVNCLMEKIGSIVNSIDIHSFFDGGFNENSKIKMSDGTFKNISDISVGEILENDIKVFGIVVINGPTLYNRFQHDLGNGVIFEGGPKLNPVHKNLEKTDKNLYHLITEKKYFYINGVKIYHYDSNVELFLENSVGNYYL